tara:strand:+ start:150 stop:359 length:210 start_codon:yes stop_codon:yes gene_type:complete
MKPMICPKCESDNVNKVKSGMGTWVDQMHCRHCDNWFSFKTMIEYIKTQAKQIQENIKTEYDKAKENVK